METVERNEPTPATWYPPDYPRQPRGMIFDDFVAWREWLGGPGARWKLYAYDMELLTQPIPADQSDPGLIKMWLRNTARRIDAVGLRGDVYDIFEARRFAGWSAIAQLMGYRDLWRINFPSAPLGDLWLITTRCDDAIRMTADRAGVRVWCAGEDAEP